jgi:hypothetical protein
MRTFIGYSKYEPRLWRLCFFQGEKVLNPKQFSDIDQKDRLLPLVLDPNISCPALFAQTLVWQSGSRSVQLLLVVANCTSSSVMVGLV